MSNQGGWNRADTLALSFAVAFPTLVTWVYFVALSDQSSAVQQTAYVVGKAIQFAFPTAWAWWTGRLIFRRPFFSSRGAWTGIAFGAIVAGAMIGLYFGWLKSSPFFIAPASAIRAKVAGIGVQSIVAFAALGAFYSLCHSLMEEYYWRWFVFGLLRRNNLAANLGMSGGFDTAESEANSSPRASLTAALLVSSIGFMAHHVLLLAAYFGWSSPATYVFSLCVAVGGIAWGWLYERTGSLFGTWLSHLLVDAAIFVIGYAIVQSS